MKFVTRQLLLTFTAAGCIFAQAPTNNDSVSTAYGRLPLVFEPNVGQTDPQVRFLTRSHGMTVFFTDSGAVMSLHRRVHGHRDQDKQAVVQMRLLGATAPSTTAGIEPLQSKSNYFIGADPAAWHTNVPNYAKVRHTGVYPGIDMVYYGNNSQLEYDFVVAPEANPNQVQLSWEGVESVSINTAGDVILKTPLGDMIQKKPRVYQDTPSGRVEIAANYMLNPQHRVLFALAPYDRERALVIDPVVYATYLGGTGSDEAYGIAVDRFGCAYVTGTAGTNFPTKNPFDSTMQSYDAFVTKFNAAGTQLIYSTFFGGSGNEHGNAIAVDSTGAAYITGDTTSGSTSSNLWTRFPTTSGAFQTTYNGAWDAFITKFSPDGASLLYSSYLGGDADDVGNAVAVDSTGAFYVTGQTSSPSNSIPFPVQNAFQPTNASTSNLKRNVFVTKFSPTYSVVFSTYLGGTADDIGFGIAADSSGSAYVTGNATSNQFPTLPVVQPLGSNYVSEGFLTKFSSTGNVLYSMYLSGDNATATAVAVDASGNAYVTGSTKDKSVVATQGAYQSSNNGNSDAFVTKVSTSGSILYTTYLGGSGNDYGLGIAVDSAGSAYIAGWTTAEIAGLMSSNTSDENGFVVKMTRGGENIVYASHIGGSATDHATAIAVDSLGAAYVTGYTYSTDLVTSGSFQSDQPEEDAFVVKMAGSPPPAPAQLITPAPGTTTGSSTVIFTWNQVAQASGYTLEVGTTQGAHDIFPGTAANQIINGTTLMVNGVPTNGFLTHTPYWVRLTTYYPGGATVVDYTFIGGLTLASNVAAMQSPSPGSTLTLYMVDFSWSAGAGGSTYKLDIGTNAPASPNTYWTGNVFSLNVGHNLQEQVYPIPIPATLYVRLSTILNGSVYWHDYTYTTSNFRK